MMTKDAMLLHPKRRKIIFTYLEVRAKHPEMKNYSAIKKTAERTGYTLDKQNGCNSYVMKTIREWRKP